MGLGALGRLSLTLYIVYFVGLGFNVAQIVLAPEPAPWESMALVALLGAVGTVMFFLPLASIHNVMVGERRRNREAIWKLYERWSGPSEGSGGPAGSPSLRDLQKEIQEVEHAISIDAAERRVEAVPAWPVNAKILTRLTAAPISLVLAFVIRFVLSRFFGF